MVHYFDEARVKQLLSVPELLQGVREALVALTLGQVVQPLRMVMPIGETSNDGLLFLKPAQLGDALSTKLITLVPGNAQKGLPTLLSTIVLMDPATGQTLAVMEGNTITAMRTAAASAVGSRLGGSSTRPIFTSVRAWAKATGVNAVETARLAMATTSSELRMTVLSLGRGRSGWPLDR